MLRTLYSSSHTHDFLSASGYASTTGAGSSLPSAANTASAQTMPDFIAVWVPLILGTLRKPAVSPISAPPGKHQLGNRLEAALGQRPRAVGDAPAALEGGADGGVGLEPLELVERD